MTLDKRDAQMDRTGKFEWVGAWMGRIALPVGVKFVISLIGIVGLMTLLSSTGLSELSKANSGATDMINSHTKSASLRNLATVISETKLIGTALFAGTLNAHSQAKKPLELSEQVSWLHDVVDMNQLSVDRSSRFGDQEESTRLLQQVKELRKVGREIAGLHKDGKIQAAKALFESQLMPGLLTLEEEVRKLNFDLRLQMRDSADAIETSYQSARIAVLGVSGLAVFLAVIIGMSMSASIAYPLRRIGGTLEAVANGTFDVRVSVPNRDELGTLAENVNAMSARLGTLYEEVETQKTQLEGWNAELETKVTAQVTEIERANRLRRFLPGQVADLLTGSESEAEALATKRGEITVLFADLRGFTGFANQATPQQVVDALNTFHATCGPLIESRSGTLERFLGDVLMVLFGAPLPVEDPAGTAVALARDMQKAVHEAMAPFRTGDKPLGLGIGIGTGAATLGRIGLEERMDYSAIGPAPNLAARLCDVATDGQILISHATAWQVDAEMKPAGPFDLKGVGPEIAAFELT